MGMNMGSGSGKNPSPVMNVTPLVDVALVVLIIFMMVTPMMTKSFWLNLPMKPDDKAEPEAAESKKNEPLVMTVDQGGTIRVNTTVLQKNEIATRLPRMLAAKTHKVLYFDAHSSAPYGLAAEAMDLARAAGAKSIAILTKPVLD
jgi:biopolymer transport protein ExbD